MNSKKIEFYEDLFQDYLDGQLDSNSKNEFEDELTSNKSLSQNLDQYKNVVGLEKKYAKSFPVQRLDFSDGILELIREESHGKPQYRLPLGPIGMINYCLLMTILTFLPKVI